MVYNRRVRQTLQNLRERPKDEKTAIAGSIAIGVVALLFIAWLIYFFHSIATTPVPDLQGAASQIASSSGLDQAQSVFSSGEQQLQPAYGSTTQFIDSASGTIQLEEVSSTSVPSL